MERTRAPKHADDVYNRRFVVIQNKYDTQVTSSCLSDITLYFKRFRKRGLAGARRRGGRIACWLLLFAEDERGGGSKWRRRERTSGTSINLFTGGRGSILCWIQWTRFSLYRSRFFQWTRLDVAGRRYRTVRCSCDVTTNILWSSESRRQSRTGIDCGDVLIIRLLSNRLACDVLGWDDSCRCWINDRPMNDFTGEIFRHSLMSLFEPATDCRRRTRIRRLTRADRSWWDCSSRRIIRIRRAGEYWPKIVWISFKTDST